MAFYDFWFNWDKYNRVSKLWWIFIRWRYEKILRKASSYLNNNSKKILELWPWRWWLIDVALMNKIEYYGIEWNKLNSIFLSEKYKWGIILKNYLFPPIEFDNETFDIIFMDQVFEHMKDIDTAENLLSEIKRVLKKWWILISIAPDYILWGKLFIDWDYTHKTFVTKNIMKQYIENAWFNLLYNSYISFFLTWFFFPTLLSLTIKVLYPVLFLLFRWNDYLKTKLIKFRLWALRSVYTIAINDDK